MGLGSSGFCSRSLRIVRLGQTLVKCKQVFDRTDHRLPFTCTDRLTTQNNYTHTHTHTTNDKNTHTHTHTHTHTQYKQLHTPTHTTHPQTHTHTHTQPHTHTHSHTVQFPKDGDKLLYLPDS